MFETKNIYMENIKMFRDLLTVVKRWQLFYGYRLKTNESVISFSVSLELRQLESASMLIGPLLKEVIKTAI